MKWLEGKRLHALLVLTERPSQWGAWQILPILLALVVSAGFIWSQATGDTTPGCTVALSLLGFALVDWALLAILPLRDLSFGAVQPPWLGLTLLRWLIALGAVALFPVCLVCSLLVLATAECFVLGLMVYGTMIEPFRTKVSHIAISNEKLSNPGGPLRIIHLSDLHVERLTPRERALPSLVSGLDPDLIVLTGDFLSTSYNDDPHAVADLQALVAQFHAPGGIYAVWGTTDVDRPEVLRHVLTSLGIVLLEDRAVLALTGSHRLWLMGLNCTRDLAADGRKLRALLNEAPKDALTLLLYHTPDLMPQAAALEVDLYLAGHTHGGQWRLPGFGAILTSSRYWKRYEAGHYRQGNTDLYVSRGLGMEGFGAPRARFFCPPEVVLLTLSGVEKRE